MAGYNTSVQTPILNTSIVYDFPAEAGNLPGKEVYFVLYNQSPYVCEAATAFDLQYCAAFTADAYVVPTHPYPKIIITPQSNLGSDSPLAAQIYGTWYTNKDDIPLTTVPASLFGSTESILTDNPQLLAVELNRSTTGGFLGGAIDVRRFQSFQMSVQYEAANAGPPANTGLVAIDWADTAAFGNFLHSQEYEINSINSTDCGRTVITDAMHGPFMRYWLRTGNGSDSTMSLVLYGSSRPIESLRISERGGNTLPARGMSSDGVVVAVQESAVAAATSFQRNMRIGNGPHSLSISVGNNGGPWEIRMFSPDIGDSPGMRFIWKRSVAAGSEQIDRISLPTRGLCLYIANLHATVAGFIALSVIRG